MNDYNKDRKRHGKWVVNHSDGTLSYKANYKDGILHGYLLLLHFNGSLEVSGFFKNNREVGLIVKHNNFI